MATGMVLVIVTRNIDLSVGSILGFVGMIMGVVQARMPAAISRLRQLADLDPRAAAAALLVGLAIGAFQGIIIAYLEVPSFIVTLGGLLVWRGAAWWVTSGQTVAPMDTTFQLMGGGADGSIGATWSWIVGVVACVCHRRSASSARAASASASAFRCVRSGRRFSVGARLRSRSRRGLGRSIPITGRSASPRSYAEANNITVAGRAACSSPTASPCRC